MSIVISQSWKCRIALPCLALLLSTAVLHAEPLVAIDKTCVCNLYIPGLGTRSKLLVNFEYPHWLPRDLRSLHVFGPDQYRFTFRQSPMDGWTWNGYLDAEYMPGYPLYVYYMAFQAAPLKSGTYLVVGIDRLGNVTTRQRPLQDRSDVFIPQIDSIDYRKFYPVQDQTGVSLTPTIRWDIAEGANLYYMLRVLTKPLAECYRTPNCEQAYSDDIFGNGTGLDKSSTQIPVGALQPNTTYYWFVEVCDSDIVNNINNCAFLPTFTFTTGSDSL